MDEDMLLSLGSETTQRAERGRGTTLIEKTGIKVGTAKAEAGDEGNRRTGKGEIWCRELRRTTHHAVGL